MSNHAGTLAVLFVLGSALVGFPQSLADVADAEKARRNRNAPRGPIDVIGDDDLAAARGDGVSVMGRSAEPRGGAEPPESEAGAAAPEQRFTAEQVRDYRETWARVWKAQVEAARDELALARDAVFQCQSASHYVYVPLNVECRGVLERRAAAVYRVKELERNRYNWELLLPGRDRDQRLR